jgi:hypothetical protein
LTVIVPAETETDTSSTPGTRRTAVVIFAAQDAQSMPSTRKRLKVVASLMAELLVIMSEELHPLATRGASGS